MRLVADWRRILKRAWSIRPMLLAGVFSGLEVALPLIDGLFDVPPGLFAAASGLTTAAAFASHLVAQNSLQEKTP